VLADAVRRGETELAAVVAVGGNVGIERTAANAAHLVDVFGLACPTYAGAGEPLAGAIPGDAAHVHGDDGIGGLWTAGVAVPEPSPTSTLVDVVASAAPLTLIATGPLTNVARMLADCPDLGRYVERLVVMGGAFGDPAGNVTPHAEFNAWIDPEAAEVVFASQLPVTLVPLDVTTKVALGHDDAARLEATAGGPTLTSTLIRRGADLYERLGLVPTCEMHDPLAAAVALDPTLVSVTPMRVTVDSDGAARGRTRPGDDDRRPIDVALGIDAPAVTAHLFDRLSRVTDRAR
jgi:inosine-uridine nucleoside N-ribohydrolase